MDSAEPSKKSLKSSVAHCYAGGSKGNETNYSIINLPQELLIKIFKYLDFRAICQCATVCRTFRSISNDPTLYDNVLLQQGMTKEHLEVYTSKISSPEKLTVIYKKNCTDDVEFNRHTALILQKCTRLLKEISICNCRSDAILKLVFECEGLTKASFTFCKGYNTQLKSTKLTSLHFETCDVPSNVLCQILKDNLNLKSIALVNNINLHTNGIAKILGCYNLEIENIYFVEKRRIRARGIESIARCRKLKNLLLSGSPFQCDPENSFEHLSAGCPLLERLSIHGWKGLTDDKLMPILQSCTQLKYLDFRGIDITIKSCREAALSLPLLKHMDFDKCERVKRAQLLNLKKDFPEINIVVY